MNRYRDTSLPASTAKPDALASRTAIRLRVRGRVQGVGFRPFVFRLARQCRLAGQVANHPEGVLIDVEGDADSLERFRQRLVSEAPAAAIIDVLQVDPIPATGRATFVIVPSESKATPAARVPPDLATCTQCRQEIFQSSNRRRHYPFTNCTACGPRYSILEAMPYDRPATSMRRFTMCSECVAEYESPNDRRFHAQPNACRECGPGVALLDTDGRSLADATTAVSAAAVILRQGKILALKGLGGFQLIVRADQSESVLRLRRRKNRPSKPLAVMVPSLEAAKQIAVIGAAESEVLRSSPNPIVLLAKRPGALPDLIAPRVGCIGVMLPTTPLHHMLLAELPFPVVTTSGNRGNEPIITDEHEALSSLHGIADVFLVHDRQIVRHVDDSVVRVIGGKSVTIRLARGFAPLPLPSLEKWRSPSILALGGHQNSAIAFWSGAQAVLTQHLGDLDGVTTRETFDRMADDLPALYRSQITALACDLHPDYFTTRWARDRRLPVHPVQHHHAHAVACMVEHDLLDREVLALTWDGTGYGIDGTIWGGEILRARCSEFERVASLLPFPLPGGERAIRHPNRIAFGLLWLLLGPDALLRDKRQLCRLALTLRDAQALAAMIQRGVNTPWTSSVGRLFDGVAALTLGPREVSYEGEAAMWLEAVAEPGTADAYPLPSRVIESTAGDRSVARGDWRPMVSEVLRDLDTGVDVGIVAARFHNALAGWATATAAQHPHRDVVLGGGCFQNRFLAERILDELKRINRHVYFPNQIPPGDGGLAVGQLAVAMARVRS